MTAPLEPGWRAALSSALASPSFAALSRFVDGAREAGIVYPPADRVFAAFDRTPFDRVKVVILGQDPYHEPGQAQGLAFYVPPSVPPPPSLKNIARERADDLGLLLSGLPDLLSWAAQGVLLLNATLTVQAGAANSHRGKGWEELTDAALDALNAKKNHLVFILWGKSAQAKAPRLDFKRHLILSSPHPSPLSAHRGFFGSKPFSKTNAYLAAHGIPPINW